VDVRAVVERIWPGQSPRVEVLGGGLTNHNYKVVLEDGDAFVVRIAGRDTGLLGIDREVEHEASRIAARAGVGPEVVAFVDRCLVTRFVEGEIVPVDRMRDPGTVRRVGEALGFVHPAGTVAGTFDSFRVVEAYREAALARAGAVPDRYDDAHELAGRIERTRAAAPVLLCHNDLLNANFIDSPDGIRIVDWEYAGMGDPFFDLANFAVNHDLDEEGSRALLEAYAGEAREEDERALVLMRFMSDFREAMWGVVQAAVSELDVDFEAYAAEHFDRLERTAASSAFREALENA
jgi:thiamine kinase-like enzyme